MAFSSVRENVTQHLAGNVLENVIIYRLFYLIIFHFIIILFYFIIITDVIVILRYYIGSLMEMNKLLLFLAY